MRFRQAMTLTETLLVFVIIGIIASFTLNSMKPWEKSYKYIYSRMLNALNTSIYNNMANTGKFPETTTDFCKALLEYMNTPGNLVPSVVCAEASTLGNNPASFDASKGIKLTNGAIMWIGGNEENKYFTYTYNDNNVYYYLVYVDLNGSAAPNSPAVHQNTLADVVAFAVTDKFTVVPLGVPEYDTRYLQAHVVLPAENEDEEDIVTDPMPYVEAKRRAFGFGLTDGTAILSVSEPMTLDLQSQLPETSPFRIDYSDTKVTSLLEGISLEGGCDISGSDYATWNDPICHIKIYDYH